MRARFQSFIDRNRKDFEMIGHFISVIILIYLLSTLLWFTGYMRELGEMGSDHTGTKKIFGVDIIYPIPNERPCEYVQAEGHLSTVFHSGFLSGGYYRYYLTFENGTVIQLRDDDDIARHYEGKIYTLKMCQGLAPEIAE